jgi:hypothetical protein
MGAGAAAPGDGRCSAPRAGFARATLSAGRPPGGGPPAVYDFGFGAAGRWSEAR